MEPSIRPGIGAVCYAGGVTFRTWAPMARAVEVQGASNGWEVDRYALSSEGNGYWSVDVPGAGPGHQYKFSFTTANNDRIARTDSRARCVTSSVGSGIVYAVDSYDWGNDRYSTPTWNTAVIYELHVGTFTGGVGGVGTLRGAIAELNYLHDLGINAIELMPVGEFGGFRSKGYNTMLPFAVESDYGGPDALKDFVREAHRRSIAVIVDVIYNHFGAADLEQSLWRYDGWSENGGGGIYFYNDWRAATPWQSPRPDYGRPEVRDYIVDNAMMWLEEYRLDGLRLDQTAQIWSASGTELREGWWVLQRLNNTIDERQPWKISIAEDFSKGWQITDPTSWGGAGFDAQWDPFVHQLRAALTAIWDDQRDLYAVADALTRRGGRSAFARVIYTESHDEDGNGRRRLPEEISPGTADSRLAKKRSTLGAALTLTAPAIPMLFQGQEFLEDRWWTDEVMLDWSKRDLHQGILRLYRDLIQLRRNWHNTTRGLSGEGMNLHHMNNVDKLLAYHRWDQGGPRDDVVVVANFSARTWSDYRIGLPRGGTWHVRFNSDAIAYDFGFGNVPGFDTDTVPIPWDNMPVSAVVGVGQYSVLIFSQEF